MRRIAGLVGVLLLPGAALAHPGHGPGGAFGLSHYLTDPFHLGAVAVAIAVAVLAGVASRLALGKPRRAAGVRSRPASRARRHG